MYQQELGKNLPTKLSNLRSLYNVLTLIRVFLGPSPSVYSGKKSKIIADDVTVATEKIKIMYADRV